MFPYPPRTEKNILDSDGTLIITHGKLTGGSALTRKLAKKHDRPWIHLDMDKLSISDASKTTASWIDRNNVQVLNVAGSRASKEPEIYKITVEILKTILTS